MGTSPENIRHFLELRGVGIINARRIFGMGSIKETEKINMVTVSYTHLDVYKRQTNTHPIPQVLVETMRLELTTSTLPV